MLLITQRERVFNVLFRYMYMYIESLYKEREGYPFISNQ